MTDKQRGEGEESTETADLCSKENISTVQKKVRVRSQVESENIFLSISGRSEKQHLKVVVFLMHVPYFCTYLQKNILQDSSNNFPH